MISTPYIFGKPLDIPPSLFTDVVNPADQKPFARIFMGKAEHMRAAIDAWSRDWIHAHRSGNRRFGC